MDGWVKLNRNFLDWEWYSDAIVKSVMLHFILNANFKPTRYRGYDIGVGSLVCRTEQTAHELGISVQQFRTAVDKLTRTGEITKNSTNKFTIINVCKYESYQLENESRQQTSNKQATNKITNKITNKNANVNICECESYILENESEQQANNKQITNKQQTNNKQCLFIINREECKKERKKESYINLKRDKEKNFSSKIENETMNEIELEEDEKISAKQKTEEGGSHSEEGKSVGGCVPQTQYTIRAEESKEYLMGLGREWRDSVKMFLRIGDDDGKLDLLITMFCAKLRSEGSPPKSENQLRGHFNNWARIFLSDERKEERSLSRGGSVAKSGGDCFSAYAQDIDGKNFAESWDKYLNKKR